MIISPDYEKNKKKRINCADFHDILKTKDEKCTKGGEYFRLKLSYGQTVITGNNFKKERTMKKIILTILFAGLFIASSYAMSEAFSADSPFTNSFVEVIPGFNSFGDHAVITYESTDANGSFFAFLLDSNGFPVSSSATFNWVYLFADVAQNGTLNIYGSDSGSFDDWHFIGNF